MKPFIIVVDKCICVPKFSPHRKDLDRYGGVFDNAIAADGEGADWMRRPFWSFDPSICKMVVPVFRFGPQHRINFFRRV